ncbi:hypothetical protein KTT_48480 [Tengunoibacter tsumagoiensis]|uniref:N-acetyltransferase domain-containing protein n=2 Tax=Tengunoibacter tsumagoiensis TaxID=2014871 RepID=A0A402A7G8_9CHLR|nr:hypothetical protein KTT_48480 [Tengunoibacter tsumagoiensis]
MFSNESVNQMVSLTIRPCREEDLQHVVTLSSHWEEEQITTGYGADDADYFRGKISPFFLLALDGETIVGFLTASLHEASPGEIALFPTGGSYLEIDDLYLLAPYREKKVGTQLMNTVMQTARSQGIEHFSLYSSSKDWKKIAMFYERLGFTMWFIRMFQ